jgi:phospholipid-binding lipoprotein MlaA
MTDTLAPSSASKALMASIAAAALMVSAAPANADEPVYDPFEGFNRAMFAVHEGLDKTVFEPAAKVYTTIVPSPVQEGVGNVLSNLNAPVVLANDVLQLEPARAGTTAGRFLINSTLGLGGVFDVASLFGLQRHDEDFGQTLAKWGAPAGPYLFIPGLGPTNLRDGVGRGVDAAIDPLNSQDYRSKNTVRGVRAGLTVLQTRADLLGAIEEVRQASDPYLTLRTTYTLLRESEINNGKAATPEIPELDPLAPEAAPEATPETAPAPPPIS